MDPQIPVPLPTELPRLGSTTSLYEPVAFHPKAPTIVLATVRMPLSYNLEQLSLLSSTLFCFQRKPPFF